MEAAFSNVTAMTSGIRSDVLVCITAMVIMGMICFGIDMLRTILTRNHDQEPVDQEEKESEL